VPLKKTGRLFRRGDGKYMIYIPKDLGDDSQFPFPLDSQEVTIRVNLSNGTLVISKVEE
jgi:hypothetical protein